MGRRSRCLRPCADPCRLARPLLWGLGPRGLEAMRAQSLPRAAAEAQPSLCSPCLPAWRLQDPGPALRPRRPFRSGPTGWLRMTAHSSGIHSCRGPEGNSLGRKGLTQRPRAQPPPSVSGFHLPGGLAGTVGWGWRKLPAGG